MKTDHPQSPLPYRYADMLVLALLIVYVLAGMGVVPFHADEADHLFKARDYAIYFVLGDPGRLRVEPPVEIDSEQHIRLLTGTTSAYLTGFILWHSSAVNLDSWPAAWYYPDSPAENRAAGRVPSDEVLGWGRLGSTLFTMSAVVVMYLLGTRLHGRGAGLASAVLFALHPVVLVNGRRVMQEGALMLFALLLLWLGIRFRDQPGFRRAFALGIGIGVALASKPTLLIAVGAIIVAIFGSFVSLSRKDVSENMKDIEDRHVGLSLHTAYLGSSILFSAVAIYLLLTPAIWSNPIQRTYLAAQLRSEVLQGQTTASSDAYSNRFEQAAALLTIPFPGEIQFHESPAFANDAPLQTEIRHYQNNIWRGIILPAPIGMSLALLGIMNLFHAARSQVSARMTLIWVGLIGLGIAAAVPLGWQRYYLLWTIAVILCAGIGLDVLIKMGLRRFYVPVLA